MKRTLAALSLAAALATPLAAQMPVGSMTAAPARIVTSGEAEIRVVPDRASISIGVQTRAATAALASSDNARRQKAIIDTLRAMGLSAEQITTQNYSVYPETRYEPTTGVGKVIGYNVSNIVRVDLRRVDQVGPFIDATLAKGANQINSIQFSSSTAAEARRTAMADAVRDARADAEVLARAAGGTLGSLIELTSNSAPIRPMFGEMAMAAAKDRAQTPIQPGEQTISAAVTVVWQFVPGTGR